MRVSNNKDNIDWKNVIKKEVIGTDGLDLGEVVEIGDNFIVIQKGLFNKKRFVIPNSTAESFDGDILRVKVNESELAGYEETADPAFKDYSKFKSSDMSKEMETRIPVIGENLQVSKKVVEDKVDIIKEPIKETKTVEIDLTYEKVTIERIPINNEETGIEKSPGQNQGLGGSDIERPVSPQTQSLPDQNQGLGGSDIERPVSPQTQSLPDQNQGLGGFDIERPVSPQTQSLPDQNQGLGGSDIERPVSPQTQSLPDQNQGLGGSDIERPVSSRTQISIPLKREVPVIIKNPYVREEVVIRKKPVKETKIITSDVTNEEVTFEDKTDRD